jgi:hypothetical protein
VRKDWIPAYAEMTLQLVSKIQPTFSPVAFPTVARYSARAVSSTNQHHWTQEGRIHMSRTLAQSPKAIARETGTGSYCPRHLLAAAGRNTGLPANRDWMFMR